MVYNQLQRVLIFLSKVDDQFSSRPETSAFDAFEMDAQSLGIGTEDLAVEESQWLASFTASYGDDGCLSPEEVEGWVQGQSLSVAGQTHVEACPACRSLVAAARPVWVGETMGGPSDSRYFQPNTFEIQDESEWLASFTASYSDDGCLSPEEVEGWVQGQSLSVAGQTHVEACPACRSLVAAARPERGRCQQVGLALSQITLSKSPNRELAASGR